MPEQDFENDLDWAIEMAARAMYVEKHWTSAITEPDHLRQEKRHYEAIVGGYWDGGRAGVSNYQMYRALAAVAVPAAIPGIVSDIANEIENARIEPSKDVTPLEDMVKPRIRLSDAANWLRRRATARAREAFLSR
jgi:hypothetical protein